MTSIQAPLPTPIAARNILSDASAFPALERPRDPMIVMPKKAFVLLPLVMLGCYVPELADPMTLAPGESLRLLLTPQGQARMDEITPIGDREVAGQLVRVTGDSLTLTARLSSGASSIAGTPSTLRQTLTFARMDIQQATVPRLHVGRTAAVIGGALVVAGLLIADVFDFRGNSPGDPGSPTPTPFRPVP